jgi:3-deoxy-manno-octulosonate cytidylyltransferase (CMP-KDO synthetase)
MTTVAVIPARYASTRFPGKPIARETGRCLVEHVYERAVAASRVDRVVIATDDERIRRAVVSFGGEVCMTRPDHACGTDRVAETAEWLGLADDALVLNIQGDEPELAPQALDRLIEDFAATDPDCGIATLAVRFDDAGPREGLDSPLDPNCVKVVVDERGRALYFSRSLVPYPRSEGGAVDRPSRWLLHQGVYAFRAGVLRRIGAARSGPATELERTESLEQLRWLASGYAIQVVVTPYCSVGIDTREAYERFVQRYLAGAEKPIAASRGC